MITRGQTHAEMATFLVTASAMCLLSEHHRIRQVLAEAGFDRGQAYLDAFVAASQAARHRGALCSMELDGLTVDMNHVAAGGRLHPLTKKET